MRVIANSQLTGDYGTVAADQEFDPGDELGARLLKSGMVRHATPPRVEYETKVIVPEAPEVGPRQPFCDVPLPDAEPKAVASEGDPMFPAADVSSVGAFDPRGRRGRAGSRSRR
jgi:hypothetical protein